MVKFLKKYIPMIISILFFFIYSGLIGLVFIDPSTIVESTTNYIVYMVLMFSIIIIFIIEMIFFIVKAATNKNMKDNALWAVLIYLFNVFIIPYYNFKYVVKSKKIKIDMTIYISLSVIALILGFITPKLILKTDNISIENKLYLEKDDVEFKFVGNYVEEKNIGDYDLYASDYDRLINIGIYIYDEEYDVTLDEIQKLNSEYIQESRENAKLVHAYTKKMDDRNILSEEINAKYEGSLFTYKISTVEFKEYDYILNIIMVTFEEDFELYKEELDQFLLDIKINK